MKINKDSRISMSIDIIWEEDNVKHVENYFIRPHMWLDADTLPKNLYEWLEGKDVGDIFEFTYSAGELFEPYSSKNILPIKWISEEEKSFFKVGRFYPLETLMGREGKNSIEKPFFRCIEKRDDLFFADFNHPLSEKRCTLRAKIIKVVEQLEVKCGTGGICYDWLSEFGFGIGMQGKFKQIETDFYSENSFIVEDSDESGIFYESNSSIINVDLVLKNKIGEILENIINDNSKILDIMGRATPYLRNNPDITIVGLNKEVSSLNKKISSINNKNIFKDSRLPYHDNQFDIVICSFCFEYIPHPHEFASEVKRVLKADGSFVTIFTNRYFKPKSILLWSELNEFERLGYLQDIYKKTNFKEINTYTSRGYLRALSDPEAVIDRHSAPLFLIKGNK
ncbi:MAG TPA: methyltransferase domain-containing protein [Thermodesulfobium narugense]|nr:methyltransferase domain-containing protein [Thermodesulfobium narugense]